MNNIEIEFSILSNGTERDDNSLGYMAITKSYNNCRYLIPVAHGIKYVQDLQHQLNCEQHSIANIAISRFQLISTMNFGRLNVKKKDKILVCGLGCVGLGALLEFHRLNISNIDSLTQKQNAFEIISKIDKTFNAIKKTDYKGYKYIIDATGSGDFLNNLISKADNFCNIAVLGTPRTNNYIDALLLHRKNITLYGFHEINGFSDDLRNKLFEKILKSNIEISDRLKNIIFYYHFTDENRELCLRHNKNMLQINIFKAI